MSNVIAVRVSKDLKKELESLNIDYAEEVRKYLEKKVRQRLLANALAKINDSRRKLEKKTGKTSGSANIIRLDREHVH